MTDPASAANDYPAFLRDYAAKLAKRDIGFEDNDLAIMLPHVADELEAKDAEIARLKGAIREALDNLRPNYPGEDHLCDILRAALEGEGR